jgi:hypothetical protein
MPTETDLYVPRNPGDLVTAEDWNDLQKKIQDDIDAKVKKGVEGVTSVKNAESSDKLQDKTPEQLAKEIVDKALAELTKVTGYRNYFKLLKLGVDSIIKHGLRASPLVDIYQLDYFPVICSKNEQKTSTWVNYYIYHSSEKTLRLDVGAAPVVIQPTKEPYFRIPFSEMLSRYDVHFNEDSSVDDLVTEFWQAFFNDPNDAFDDDQYCHSPWFDRCCGDRRTVAALKKAGNWDELWFKMLPRKTVNFTHPGTGEGNLANVAPMHIQVVHYDFDTLGLKLLLQPDPQVPFGAFVATDVPTEKGSAASPIEKSPGTDRFGPRFGIPHNPELKVMVLLNAGAGIKIEKPAAP